MSNSEDKQPENDKPAETTNCSGEGAAGGTADQEKKPSLLESTTSNITTADWLKSLTLSDKPPPESVLDDVSFEGIARYIASDKCKKIVTMVGAGISTSAGIPDFRSPGSGLYDNLEKYNLSNPTDVFNIEFFKKNPEPFFMLCKILLPGMFKPTPCHYFIKLLEKKNKLLQHFTQNIDTLERVAGLGDDKVVEAHGTFNTAHCQECNHEYTQAWTKARIFDESAESPVPMCEQDGCEGVVKPDVVFFGENLPKKFTDHISDLKECDLLVVMGTSLVVQPFASLTGRTKDNTPRLYINLEQTGSGPSNPFALMMFGGGFKFDDEDNIRDVFWQGTCDDGCYALADLLGWGKELRELVKDEHARLDKEILAASKKDKASKTCTPSL